MHSVVTVLLSLIPFVLVGGWLVYREAKSGNSLLIKPKRPAKRIRVGDKVYSVKRKSRILAVEKKTGREVIVSTCGFENENERLEGELQSLPEGIKVCYRLENGIFSPEESDWVAGEKFRVVGVTEVSEYEQE